MSETLTILPEFFTVEDGIGCYRPQGEATLEKGVEMVDEAIRFCRENRINALLANVHGLEGISRPSATERYFFASRWAETGGGKVVLSMVAPGDLLDPDRLGVLVATNRGMITNATSNESEGMAWIRKKSAPPVAKPESAPEINL